MSASVRGMATAASSVPAPLRRITCVKRSEALQVVKPTKNKRAACEYIIKAVDAVMKQPPGATVKDRQEWFRVTHFETLVHTLRSSVERNRELIGPHVREIETSGDWYADQFILAQLKLWAEDRLTTGTIDHQHNCIHNHDVTE